MVAYQRFVELTQSSDSEERGQAAHLAALVYLAHTGPADEGAALYAALIGFLDDPSVKVRAALAYGLLHAANAPRPILLALLHDSPIISRAAAQYSPALADTDLLLLIRQGDAALQHAIAARQVLSERVCRALLATGNHTVLDKLLSRHEVPLPGEDLTGIARAAVSDAALRGVLLARPDLPARARLILVEAVAEALRETRIVCGAVAPARLERLLRNATDAATSTLGEEEAVRCAPGYAASLLTENRLSARLLLHALCSGQVLFFAECLAELAAAPRSKVFALLESGSRAALHALLSRCGLGEAVRNLLARMILQARSADIAHDATARHYLVTAITEDLLLEHGGDIPAELEDCFLYLSEQNIGLAREAAQGVMAAFAGDTDEPFALPAPVEQLALPAA